MTDDTTAFNVAINVHNSVYIPAGVCVLSNAVVGDGSTVRGENINDTTVILKPGATTGRAAITNADHVGGNSNITITNLTIDGNHANQGNDADGQQVFALWLYKVTGFALQNVRCVEGVNQSLMIQLSHNGTVVDCEGHTSAWDTGIEINGGGIAEGATNITLLRCTAHDNLESGIECDAGAHAITITDCISYDNGMHGFECEHHYIGESLEAETSIILISGGESYQNGNEGVFIKAYYVTVDGLHTHHNAFNGVVARADGDNATIQNTESNHNSQYGILIDGGAGCTCADNNAHDNTLGDVVGC